MITSLPERVAALPDATRAACERIYTVQRGVGRMLPPPEMEPWLRERFGPLEAVREQTVVRVTNRLTLEGALFNPLRARRPAGDAVSDEALAAWVAQELAGADFADPLRRTPADVFGRIEGRFCVTASNVAKYDGWHGLVVFAEGDPLRFTRAQLADYLDVGLSWIAAAHANDPQAVYPMITWNCLPKSGATIVHGHMQIALARGAHYARPELWRRAAERYRAECGGDYCDDLFAVHAGLGLALRVSGGVRGFVHLTPLRNREVVLFATEDAERTEGETELKHDTGAEAPQEAAPSEPAVLAVARKLADPLYDVLRGLIDGQGVRALNMALALPPLAPTGEGWAGLPAVARVCDRGSPLSMRNDWGAMELYGTPVVTVDPFEVAARMTR